MSEEKASRIVRCGIVLLWLIVVIAFNVLIPQLVPFQDVQSSYHIQNRHAVATLCWALSWLIIPLIACGIIALIQWVYDEDVDISYVYDWFVEKLMGGRKS